MEWYYSSGAEQVGPLSQADFDQHVKDGRVTNETSVWCTGMADWTTYGAYAATQKPQAAPKKAPAKKTGSKASGGWASLAPDMKQSILQGAGLSAVVLLAAFLVLKISSGSLGGGGSSGGGASTANGIAKAFVNSAGSPSAVRALFPSDDLIRSSLDCGDDDKAMRKILRDNRKERKRAVKKFGKLPKGVKVSFVRSKKMRVLEKQSAGETMGDCTLKVDITIQKQKVYFKMKQGGEVEEEDERIKIIHIDGSGWYLLDP